MKKDNVTNQMIWRAYNFPKRFFCDMMLKLKKIMITENTSEMNRKWCK